MIIYTVFCWLVSLMQLPVTLSATFSPWLKSLFTSLPPLMGDWWGRLSRMFSSGTFVQKLNAGFVTIAAPFMTCAIPDCIDRLSAFHFGT